MSAERQAHKRRRRRAVRYFRHGSERNLRLKNALGFVVFLFLAICSLAAVIVIAGTVFGVFMPERKEAVTIHGVGTQD